MYIDSILIADDHEFILRGVKNFIQQRFVVNKMSTFTDPDDIIKDIQLNRYSIYLLDLEYKEMSGFDLVKAIREKYSEAKIIVCTMHEEIWNINRLLELNVDGILLKKSSEEYLEEAIVSILDGESFMCPRFKYLTSVSKVYRRRVLPKRKELTQTERVVLKHIMDGDTSREIADKLFVTENAIEQHRKNLMIKCDARNVAHLVSIAIHQRLLDN